jgi:predicted transcriptional regulator
MMSASTTLTVRLPEATKEQLAQLAEKTRRTSSFLASEAITAYVARELEIVARIEAARANVRAGHFTPHEDVAAAALSIIEAARPRK